MADNWYNEQRIHDEGHLGERVKGGFIDKGVNPHGGRCITIGVSTSGRGHRSRDIRPCLFKARTAGTMKLAYSDSKVAYCETVFNGKKHLQISER